MTLPQAVLSLMWLGLTAYVLLAGADFGAGIWDLLAGRAKSGLRQRDFIEHSIAPVWEANHVWLIFVIVVLWTGFPTAFASVASTLYIPLTLAALGMIARGSAFAFRKSFAGIEIRRLFGAAFAVSSLVTPYFLGAFAGGIASGRVPPGIARGNVATSWLNPTSVLGGVVAVLACAYLSAAYLCADAEREGDLYLCEYFRVRALGSSVVLGVVALGGVFVLRSDAHQLFTKLIGRALPLMVASGVAGFVTMYLLVTKRYSLARATAALAVVALMWGWAVAQYPNILPPSYTIQDAAAERVVLQAMIVVLAVGSAVLLPSLWFMFRVFKTVRPVGFGSGGTGPGAAISGTGTLATQAAVPRADVGTTALVVGLILLWRNRRSRGGPTD